MRAYIEEKKTKYFLSHSFATDDNTTVVLQPVDHDRIKTYPNIHIYLNSTRAAHIVLFSLSLTHSVPSGVKRVRTDLTQYVRICAMWNFIVEF